MVGINRGSALFSNQYLSPGDWLTSPSKRYTLNLQLDGNLVIYDWWKQHAVVWHSDTHGKAVSRAVMQADGNFVIYGFPEAIKWSNTANRPGAFLMLQDDGNLVIYGTQAFWSKNNGLED